MTEKESRWVSCYNCHRGMRYGDSMEGVPEECRICWGSGQLWQYEPSGKLAEYPGGPFRG